MRARRMEMRSVALLALRLSVLPSLLLSGKASAQDDPAAAQERAHLEDLPQKPEPPPVPYTAPPAPATYPTPFVSADSPKQLEPPRLLASDRALSSGLGIGTGLGSDNVWIGGHVIFYAQLPNPKLRIAFHVGMGLLPYRDPDLKWGVRGGSFLAYGTRHRLLFGVLGGTMDWQTFGQHYQSLQSQQLYGAGVAVGYELMTEAGFYARCSFGPALLFLPEAPFRQREIDLVWRGNLLSLGYKLW